MPGWFPCCCTTPGSSVPIGSSVEPPPPPPGSSQQTLPGCEPCLGGLISRYYQIEFEGITVGGIPGCAASCNNLNGIYIIEIDFAGENGCFGSLIIPGACQDVWGGVCYRELLLSFGMYTPTLGVPVRVRFGPHDPDLGVGECSNVATMVWQGYMSNPDQKAACLEFNHETLPFLNRTGAIWYCDPSASTAYITAL